MLAQWFIGKSLPLLYHYICLVLRNSAKIFVILQEQLQGVCRSANCMTGREKLRKLMQYYFAWYTI